jgi:hypothetical protein
MRFGWGSYFSPADVVRERLEHHVIADDVVVEDQTTRWAGVSLWSDDVASWRERTPAGAIGFSGRRDRGPNLEWMFPLAAGEPEWVADLRVVGAAAGHAGDGTPPDPGRHPGGAAGHRPG